MGEGEGEGAAGREGVVVGVGCTAIEPTAGILAVGAVGVVVVGREGRPMLGPVEGREGVEEGRDGVEREGREGDGEAPVAGREGAEGREGALRPAAVGVEREGSVGVEREGREGADGATRLLTVPPTAGRPLAPRRVTLRLRGRADELPSSDGMAVGRFLGAPFTSRGMLVITLLTLVLTGGRMVEVARVIPDAVLTAESGPPCTTPTPATDPAPAYTSAALARSTAFILQVLVERSQ